MRFGRTLLVVALAASSVVVPATTASARPTSLTPVAVTAPAMHPGETAWVSIVWKTEVAVDDVAVTVDAPPGTAIEYPSGRSSTSLYGSSSLAKGTQDFTAFRVSVPYGAAPSLSLQVHARWVRRGNEGRGRGSGAGEPGALDTTFTVPLRPYVGPALVGAVQPVAVQRSSPAWSDLTFRALAPRLDDVRVTVAGPPDLVVTYPGEGTSSGLDGGPSLLAGGRDRAAVRLDASALAPGRYTLRVTATYTTSQPGTTTTEVPLVVS